MCLLYSQAVCVFLAAPVAVVLLHHSVAGLSPRTLGARVEMPSLEAHVGAWRLPIWQGHAQLCKILRGEWRSWAQSARLPIRAVRAGRAGIESVMASFNDPAPPVLWRRLEERMCLAIAGKNASRATFQLGVSRRTPQARPHLSQGCGGAYQEGRKEHSFISCRSTTAAAALL